MASESPRPFIGWLSNRERSQELALGGFFERILLHLMFQWHHLLSNVQAAVDLRVQILADGLFHALMFLLGIVGLVQLWHRRAALSHARSARMRAVPRWSASAAGSAALVGFGGWHVLDAVLSHWILCIHRIRMESPQPLLWDLAWSAVFLLVPIALGLVLRRIPPDGGKGHGGGDDRGDRAAAAALGVAVLLAGRWLSCRQMTQVP